jgi:hypothetical protein
VNIGFEVLTAMAMESSVFWDITLCIMLKVNQRFAGKYRNLLPRVPPKRQLSLNGLHGVEDIFIYLHFTLTIFRTLVVFFGRMD